MDEGEVMETRESVMIEVRPTWIPASELPMGLVYDVTQVLKAHGLVIEGAEYADLLVALGRIVDAVPVERGGRK